MASSRAASELTIFTYGRITSANQAVAPMIVPPDGGWGWVVVIVGFTSATLMDGITYCFFLYRDPMTLDLGILPSDISFLSALFTGFYFLGGILACSVGNHFGFRSVMIVGSTVAASCFASGYILRDISSFFLIIGFIGGMATGFICVAATLPASFYFDKKRSLAMGLVSCGSGVGAMVMPQITTLFMAHNGWRLTFLFHSSLILILVLLGMLIRPVKPVLVIITPGSCDTVAEAGRDAIAHDQSVDYSLFRIPTADATSIFGASSMIHSVTVLHPTEYPTISQVAQDADIISIMVPGDQTRQFDRLVELNQSRNFQSSASMLIPAIRLEREEPLRRLPWYKCNCCRSPDSIPERPLLRTDLYYTGSLNRLDEYTGKDTDLDYHLHVTKVPTYLDTLQEITRTYTYKCFVHILHGIRTLLDYTLLKSPTFLCLAFCAFANYIAFYIPFLYGKIYMESIGKREYATTLVSMIGLGNMMGRISSGIIVTVIPRFGARTLVAFSNFAAGLAVLCATFNPNIIYQFSCMVFYGFTVGFFAPLRSIIVVDFMGLSSLTSVTGMLILFQGMGSFLGGPLVEIMLDYTKSGNAPYYVTAAMLMCASVMLWPMRRINNWEKRRKDKKHQQTPRV